MPHPEETEFEHLVGQPPETPATAHRDSQSVLEGIIFHGGEDTPERNLFSRPDHNVRMLRFHASCVIPPEIRRNTLRTTTPIQEGPA